MSQLFDEIFRDAVFTDDYLTKTEFEEQLEDKLYDDNELKEWLMLEWGRTDVQKENKLS